MAVRIKRAYEPPADDDGYRVLIDRLWPRGLSRERAALDEWLPEIAPSADLRRWYHRTERWPEFRDRYRRELQGSGPLLATLRERAVHGTLTLLYAARDPEHNHAAVLRHVLAEEEGG